MSRVSLENQLHSAQKNLLFLQQDHAHTLKGLHAEIRRLQQHCTDLTYELTVRNSERSVAPIQVNSNFRGNKGIAFFQGTGDSRCDELRKKCEELETQLKAKEEENTALLRELEEKNAMISVLENTIKEREKKYLEELKMKSHKLNMLSSELEQRAGTIAYLTSQLHATKKKLIATSSGTSDSSPNVSPVLSSYKPAPPKEKMTDTPRRRMKKSLSQPLNSEYAEVYRLGSDGRKLLLRETMDAMPDPTPFLLARESSDAQLLKERPLVIPPIPSERNSSAPHFSLGRDKQQHKAHIGVAHRIHHAVAPTAEAQVETLAVDQVNGSEVVRKRSGADRTA